jgi:murein DD-endopeptidase MepM/ murein hydrolase activator NlpD
VAETDTPVKSSKSIHLIGTALAAGGFALAFLAGVVIQGATQPGQAADGNERDVGTLAAVKPHDPGLMRLAALTAPRFDPDAGAAPEPVTVALEVKPGDTLMAMLVSTGVPREEAYLAIEAMGDVFDPRRIRPGQEIQILLEAQHPLDDRDEGNEELLGLKLRPNLEEDIEVTRVAAVGDDAEIAYEAQTLARELELRQSYAAASIESSLYQAAVDAGVPVSILVDLIRAYSFDVDFQREVREGDSFELLFETHRDEDGNLARKGDILTATLVLSGKPLTYYIYTPESGVTDFFDANGQSIRKALLATPVDGARISSGFGLRQHPISGYNRMHKGIDFAAPSGTPIYAAGDGVIEFAGRNGGYGNYIRIRHSSTYKTAYAHMRGFASGMGNGVRVQQGDVIGYVGSTGASTGPHLHYEVHENGGQVNPRSIRLPAGETLEGQELAALQARIQEIEALKETLRRSTLVAEQQD